MREFIHLREKLADHFKHVTEGRTLFETDADRAKLWDVYIDSFPEGTNQIYRTRREYDCSCCRHFIKDIGGVVYIDDDLKVHSIFEFDIEDDTFQPVMDALAAYVATCKIIGPFVYRKEEVGEEWTEYVNPMTWDVETYHHFALYLPQRFVFTPSDAREHVSIDRKKAHFRDTRNVFMRSLNEISLDAIDAVLELIRSNTLYKGTEWLETIEKLRQHKFAYEGIPEDLRGNYCWVMAETVGPVLGRIRNHSIGTLLTDISEGVELDEAVSRYEKIVAPANYKRPKAIFTKKMLEQAKQTVQELGYMDSLSRRFATLDDITVNNILFSNKDAARRIVGGGNVFDQMMQDADKINPKQFSRVESIGIEKFIADVLPRAREIDAFIESRHAANMVSLIAPVVPDAKTMFKWNNGFSWAYSGNMTDSDIRQNVKNAGGNVEGVLRFSIQWNDDEYDGNDLDAHCMEPGGGKHIYYGDKRSQRTGGSLDIDIINPVRNKAAVENITWPSKERMIPGTYQFAVHCYTYRGGRGGFRAEIEFDGKIFRYDYRQPMRQNQMVAVATVTLDKNGNFSVEESLPSNVSSRDIWGIKTNQFSPVSVVMYSPNYWDEQQGIGHKHYMFMLKGCTNPERPNGFYNEFLRNELMEHKRIFEALGSRMAVADTEDQLSGVGFSSTKRNDMIVRVKGSTERVMKIEF